MSCSHVATLHPGIHEQPSAAADALPEARQLMFFGAVPITETQGFPPAPAEHCWVYLTLNAEIALSVPHSPPLQRLLVEPRARVSVDGQWLWWALRRKYPRQPLDKLAGSDLIHTLAAFAAAHGRRVLLLGSTPEANGRAVWRLRCRWPALAISGYAPPMYEPGSKGEEPATTCILKAIDAWQADYVVLGLGADKEHRLAEHLAPLLDGRVLGLLCFGGAIDMAGGTLRRAPVWMQRCGLEGLFRLLQRPSRWRRCTVAARILPIIARARY